MKGVAVLGRAGAGGAGVDLGSVAFLPLGFGVGLEGAVEDDSAADPPTFSLTEGRAATGVEGRSERRATAFVAGPGIGAGTVSFAGRSGGAGIERDCVLLSAASRVLLMRIHSNNLHK